MELFDQQIDLKALFHALYNAQTEHDVEQILLANKNTFKRENWVPIGGNDSNYGIIENQQSNPIAALVEKVTNSIDAILTKKCLEAGINPESDDAPKSMDAAVKKIFPDHKQWDSTTFRRK